jgi:hypothetical protein
MFAVRIGLGERTVLILRFKEGMNALSPLKIPFLSLNVGGGWII